MVSWEFVSCDPERTVDWEAALKAGTLDSAGFLGGRLGELDAAWEEPPPTPMMGAEGLRGIVQVIPGPPVPGNLSKKDV